MARAATNVVGLDIGGEAIKAVQLRKTGEGLRVVGRPGYVPTPRRLRLYHQERCRLGWRKHLGNGSRGRYAADVRAGTG